MSYIKFYFSFIVVIIGMGKNLGGRRNSYHKKVIKLTYWLIKKAFSKLAKSLFNFINFINQKHSKDFCDTLEDFDVMKL